MFVCRLYIILYTTRTIYQYAITTNCAQISKSKYLSGIGLNLWFAYLFSLITYLTPSISFWFLDVTAKSRTEKLCALPYTNRTIHRKRERDWNWDEESESLKINENIFISSLCTPFRPHSISTARGITTTTTTKCDIHMLIICCVVWLKTKTKLKSNIYLYVRHLQPDTYQWIQMNRLKFQFAATVLYYIWMTRERERDRESLYQFLNLGFLLALDFRTHKSVYKFMFADNDESNIEMLLLSRCDDMYTTMLLTFCAPVTCCGIYFTSLKKKKNKNQKTKCSYTNNIIGYGCMQCIWTPHLVRLQSFMCEYSQ